MRPRRAIPVLLTLGIGLWCCGCASEGAGCWTALGDPVQDTVHLDTDDWDRLLVLDRVEVDWWPGDSVPFAVLHAHTGTVEGLRVTPEEDALRIENVNRCAWFRPLDAWPRVELHGVAPPRVELESQADFHMKAPWVGPELAVVGDEMAGDMDLWFEGDTLRVRLPNGIGHARVRGEARRFTAFRSGFGDLQAAEMEADQVMVHHAGVGEVRLRPAGYLFLELAGAGTVILEGPGAERDIHRLPGATGEILEVP